MINPPKIINNCEQRSEEWFELHRGRLSGSVMRIVMEGSTAAKNKLLIDMREQIANPDIPMGSNITSASLDWGIKYEPEAIAQYELIYDVDVVQPAFVIHGDLDFVGCSPDFMHDGIVGEVKCPFNENNHHLNVVLGHQIELYKPQIMTELWVTDFELNRFVSYDPRYKDIKNRIRIHEIPRDEEYINKMEDITLIYHLDEGYRKILNCAILHQI